MSVSGKGGQTRSLYRMAPHDFVGGDYRGGPALIGGPPFHGRSTLFATATWSDIGTRAPCGGSAHPKENFE